MARERVAEEERHEEAHAAIRRTHGERVRAGKEAARRRRQEEAAENRRRAREEAEARRIAQESAARRATEEWPPADLRAYFNEYLSKFVLNRY